MIQSTVGFIFNSDLTKVLLITKNRPEGQKGKLNGIGGKTEAGESAVACISREVNEETGLVIQVHDWKTVGTLQFDTWHVTIFTTAYTGADTDAQSKTDEPVSWYPVANLPISIMSNLTWLIPLSIDVLTNSPPPTVTIEY